MERHQFNSAAAGDEAIEWLARLRSHDVTPAEKADFAAWLAASDVHKQAFDDATALWHGLAHLPTQRLSVLPKRRPYTTRLPLAAAASFLIACVFMVLQLATPQFDTGKGEQRRVLLSDGSTAFLNTDSRLSVDYSHAQRKILIHQGEVWFHVKSNPNRPFVVEGQFAQATAVGTAFTVRETPGFTRVSVTEGIVALDEPQTAQTQTLIAGQQGTVSAALADVTEFDRADALAWQRGQLIYDNVRLDDLLSDLNRYLPVTMTINDAELESRRVSAVLRLDDQEAMLEALGKVMPIQWKAVSDNLIILTYDT